jgi:hypothetical protein
LDRSPIELTEFVNAVFAAEGLDPEQASRHLWRQVRDMISIAQQRDQARDA